MIQEKSEKNNGSSEAYVYNSTTGKSASSSEKKTLFENAIVSERPGSNTLNVHQHNYEKIYNANHNTTREKVGTIEIAQPEICESFGSSDYNNLLAAPVIKESMHQSSISSY